MGLNTPVKCDFLASHNDLTLVRFQCYNDPSMSPAKSVNAPNAASVSSRGLSVVIPVYNESARLDLTFAAFSEPIDWGLFRLEEIIFVNDGSTDNTLEILKQARPALEAANKCQVRILTYHYNRGKGFAIKHGMLASRGAYTLMMDADMSTPLTEVKRLQTGVKNGRAVIIGTRKSRVVRVEKEQPLVRVMLGRVFTRLSQVILSTYVSDFTCGFKLFRRDARRAIFARSHIERWGYDSEIMFLAVRLGYKPLEVAVRWRNDERSRVHIIQDAARSLRELFLIRWYHWHGRYDLQKRRRGVNLERNNPDFLAE